MKIKLLAALATAAGGIGTAIGAGSPAAAPLSATPAAAVASSNTECDAGAWRADDISVEGAPDGFDAGDHGATFIWHDGAGWHLRTTDKTDSRHVYSGRIVLSTGSFRNVEGVQLEQDDHYRVDGRTLYYRFVTYNAIDGLDFRVGDCAPGARQALAFHLRYEGQLDKTRVIVGDQGKHP